MITEKILRGGVDTVTLRQAELTDCTERYVQWLNDPEVNRFLETRWEKQDLESITDFVRGQRENHHSILFAITLTDSGRHIGNIKIGPVHPHYFHADISYFIGEKDLWGKGCATEAIGLVCRFGFEELGLHRIEAGTYEEAVGSQKALLKNGFQREGVFREQVISDGKPVDIYRYGLLVREFTDMGNQEDRKK